MSLFAIGDFHLSGEPPAKPMDGKTILKKYAVTGLLKLQKQIP